MSAGRTMARYVRESASHRSVGFSLILTLWVKYPGVWQLPGAAGAEEGGRVNRIDGETGAGVTLRI